MDYLQAPFIQQDLPEKPTDTEVKQAREVLNRAKKRAFASHQKSASELWAEFNQVKNSIAEATANAHTHAATPYTLFTKLLSCYIILRIFTELIPSFPLLF